MDWATAGTSITYAYDVNGSLVRETTTEGVTATALRYVYNLQNRLAAIYEDLNDTPENPALSGVPMVLLTPRSAEMIPAFYDHCLAWRGMAVMDKRDENPLLCSD